MTKPSPYFGGKIIDGAWYFTNRKQFDEWLMSQRDGEYQISVKRKYKPRTSGQNDEESNWNGYYWGVIIEILHDEMGLTRQDCHEELKRMFNPVGYTVKLPDGTMGRRTKAGSTKHMSHQEFINYCAEIRRWAMHPDDGYNCYIPEPHESPEAERSMEDTG